MLEWKNEVYPMKKGKPHAMALDDFNGDDRPDIAVTAWETNTIRFLLSR